MEIHSLPSLRLYWSVDPNFEISYFHLNEDLKKYFNPSCYLSVEQNMIGFKGRSSLKEYLPMKTSQERLQNLGNRYIISFDVYQGKRIGPTDGTLYLLSVVVIRNMHNPEDLSTAERRYIHGVKEIVTCPKSTSDYNMYMKGVDKFDQLMQAYFI
ncbi:hypothetical protein PR048_020216 [Dryococelus australis]|uniref:PiggyBac transposable element-derived protein domain-containing protein n=1 Tax=Dryococelus australis TaxID=614101 RepID=A0ABQ9H627_9NEOP|nr:hypothetical protein PR048_020216 [Dryococelus australis]